MKLTTLALLMLISAIASPSSAEAPKATDNAAQVTSSHADPSPPSSTNSKPWVDIISAKGPVGIAQLTANATVCGNVRLDTSPDKLIATPGKSVVAALSNPVDDDGENLHSAQEFGDCELQLEFLIGKGSNSGVKLQSRYEIQLYDSHHKETPTARECGGVYPHWLYRGEGIPLKYIDKGVPPLTNAAKPAGEWQTLKIVFKAPRFDEQGKKTANARFDLVTLNGQVIQEAVELDSPTGNASTPKPEVAKAPLMLQLDHGAVAFRNVKVKPLGM